tara:strand:- start:805 stop:1416 length:612 start_codon:yes stop_codon:yes gene_type:complete
MVLARTTKLEAVNKALQMMGEAPLNSLQGLFGLGNLAETTINSVSRKVQTEGWSFNTDYQVSLVRDSITNHISVGDNVSRVVVDPYDYPDYDVVQRGQKLYDRKNNTYVFTENIKADLTIILDWDDLPEHARVYIMTKTGRELQESMIGSKDLTEINIILEQETRAQFMEEETTLSEHSMLRGNAKRNYPVLGFKPISVLPRS